MAPPEHAHAIAAIVALRCVIAALHGAVRAATLAAEGVRVRVVSLASWELFAKQDAAYRAEVLPVDVPKVAIEAASPFGWERWVGNDPAKGAIIAIDHFGASAPFDRVYREFGLTPEAVVAAAKKLM